VKANRGAAAVDEETLAMFEQNLAGNLYKLWNRMSSGSYFPPPAKQVEIPKAKGGSRKLGIPTVSDRIAQISQRFPKGPHSRARTWRWFVRSETTIIQNLGELSAASVPSRSWRALCHLNLNDIWCRFRMVTHIDLPVQDTMAP
jgi:hypothetical protein